MLQGAPSGFFFNNFSKISKSCRLKEQKCFLRSEKKLSSAKKIKLNVSEDLQRSQKAMQLNFNYLFSEGLKWLPQDDF